MSKVLLDRLSKPRRRTEQFDHFIKAGSEVSQRVGDKNHICT